MNKYWMRSFYRIKIFKTMKKLLDLVVENIAFVAKNERPAVPKAENKFAIFKTFNKGGLNDLDKQKIEKIQTLYKD